MISKWIINVRCTCAEEYDELQRIHKLYKEEKKALRKAAKEGK